MTHDRVLLVEDDLHLREVLAETLRLSDIACDAVADAEHALATLDPEIHRAVVCDVSLPGLDGPALMERIHRIDASLPVVLMTGGATVANAVCAMRQGAADYLLKPFSGDTLVATVREHLERVRSADVPAVVVDPTMQRLYDVAARAGARDVTVLLQGESGTGKEVIARHVHASSRRAHAPFIAVNCAAIPEQMLEAVMFGHEKGAFTGAIASAPGKFEQADGGTLLLDEVTEMSLALQAKLLRVLQEQEVERVGGRRVIPLDVRVIATTNRDLAQAVRDGSFRDDLYYRLSVLPLAVPPLRERTSEILPLAAFMLQRHASRGVVPTLCADAVQALLSHPWPGNVRELENVVQRALVYCNGREIHASDLQLQTRFATRDAHATHVPDLGESVRHAEHALILRTLTAHDGSRKQTALALGVSERTLRYKLARIRDAGFDPDAGHESRLPHGLQA